MQADEYRRLYENEDTYWWFVARRRLAQRLLRASVPTGSVVLDLGCGTGAMLAEVRNEFKSLGMDCSHLALECCHNRGLDNVLLAEGTHIPVLDAAIDGVVSLDVLEHIDRVDAAIRECARILKPGGVLVVSVPAFRWLWGPHDVALMHFRRYTRRELKSALTSAGFRVIRSSYSVFILFPVVVLIRLRDRLRKGDPEVRLPRVSKSMNRLLIWLMDLESAIIARIALPWGSSVVAVALRTPVPQEQ